MHGNVWWRIESPETGHLSRTRLSHGTRLVSISYIKFSISKSPQLYAITEWINLCRDGSLFGAGLSFLDDVVNLVGV